MRVIVCAGLFLSALAMGGQFDIHGTPGSSQFGAVVAVLPNGNFIVTDPLFSESGNPSIGAAFLFSRNGLLISRLAGSTANDRVGWSVGVLQNGNYLIWSPYWNNGDIGYAGAVTWGNADTGISGTVSESNSLVGSSSFDQVGYGSWWKLDNGNYVIGSTHWNRGAVAYAGAATWGNGATGTHGRITPENSVVGSSPGDQVGTWVYGLSNGNYVVTSSLWHNGSARGAGAVTWGDGSVGTVGEVSIQNSLVGTKDADYVGLGLLPLANGNYVVNSYAWSNGSIALAGAVTLGDGSIGTVGEISPSNSLVGSSAFDRIGYGGLTALSNGNYVVSSPSWSAGGNSAVGAVTWGDGFKRRTTGAVAEKNSLVGAIAGDQVGSDGVLALSNGNYVVASPNWSDHGIAAAGAATWGDGTTGVAGNVSVSNSLVGSSPNDTVASGGIAWSRLVALANGNYVVASQFWNDQKAARVGAVTWGNGAVGTAGRVSRKNSLVGSTAEDHVGSYVLALTNGNYVVGSELWNNGAITHVGAATWRDGNGSNSEFVSVANSLVGTKAGDNIGSSLHALADGNYLAANPWWNNGSISGVGIVTWGDGNGGTIGEASSTNSLIGAAASDHIGSDDVPPPLAGITPFSDGSYVVLSPHWSNNRGAATLLHGDAAEIGAVGAANSVVGDVQWTEPSMVFGYDTAHGQLVVGRPAENTVTIFNADLVFLNGFD